MIKNGYLIVGIVYLVMAALYGLALLLSALTLTYDYFTGEKDSDADKIKYKVYWYFNNFRYALFMILCGIIGVIYIKSHEHELHELKIN